ncbi:baseplate assembly protein [Megalodesulfovibrio paquesii]
MNAFANLPPITFVDTDAETCRNAILTGFEQATGRTLYPGNPERLFLEGLAYLIAVLAGQVDVAGKQNLVAYAQGPHLDHLGAESDTPRLDVLPATTVIRFSLANAVDWPVEIPAGTRVSTADRKVVFATDAHAAIPPGANHVDVAATAMTAGAVANGLVPGQVGSLVDVRPYVASAVNTTVTVAGADVEDDEHYRQRIPGAREAYTCAGPRGQYEYHVLRVHKDIADAGIYTPVPGTVAICPIMRHGELPAPEVLEAIRQALRAEDVRPLTDTVLVRAPEVAPYAIALRWYLDKQDAALAGSIGAAVANAVEAYVQWQHAKPGRDINPDELLTRIKQAGAKRVEMAAPAFTRLEPWQIARVTTRQASYGGQEDE